MPWLILLATTWLALLLQHGWLANAPLAPDLPLALAGWLLAAGGGRVLLRAWLVGLLADLADPASTCAHAVAIPLAALAAPARQGLEPGAASLLAIPALLDLGLELGDAAAGAGGPGLIGLLGGAAATGLAGGSFALLFGGLGKDWNPVPPLPEPGFGGLRTR